jgi:beta-glucanase (GH16 family)
MKLSTLFLASLLPTTALAAPPPVPYGQPADAYVFSFADEFSGRLNGSIWTDHLWYEADNKTSNYSVENGVLKIWPQRDKRNKYFNRSINSDGKFYQQYGYIEVEMKLPRGKGVWAGFWMLNHDIAAYPDKRPEVDVSEAYPGAGPNSGWSDAGYRPIAYSSTVWRDSIDQAGSVKVQPGADLSAGFHKYGFKWEANRQSFYYDGQLVYQLDVTMPDPMYLIFNLWFGGPAGEPDSSTPTGKSNALEINYVRSWKFK